MIFSLYGPGRSNGFFLTLSILMLTVFSACQPDIEEVITKSDVDYLDSLLTENRGIVIKSGKREARTDSFSPWLITHEHIDLNANHDTLIYQADVSISMEGTGFRQDEILLDAGHGTISDLEVRAKDGVENLLLTIDSATAGSKMIVQLNRFVPRGEHIILNYRYQLSLHSELMESTRLLPFSKQNMSNLFWVDRKEWLPLIPDISNAADKRRYRVVSSEWNIKVPAGFKAVTSGKLLKESHGENGSSYYYVNTSNRNDYQPTFLSVIPDESANIDRNAGEVILHGVSEDDARTQFFADQLKKHSDSAQLPQNWFFWDYPFHVTSGNQAFVPSLALIDSTVYPEISNQALIEQVKVEIELNLPHSVDYPSTLFAQWFERAAHVEGLPDSEKQIEISRSKNRLRNELRYYMRPVFEPENDSLSFYFDAHQTEKGFLVVWYLKNTFGDEVWDAFGRELQNQDYLSEAVVKQLLSEYSGDSIDDFWQKWFYEPGFPKIYSELLMIGEEAHLRLRNIRSNSEEEPFSLDIPAVIEFDDRESTDTLFHFSTLDTLFVVKGNIQDIIIDPGHIVPALFHHRRDTTIINHRLRDQNPSLVLPLLSDNPIPANDNQRKLLQAMLLDDNSQPYREYLLADFLAYGVVDETIYQASEAWNARSKVRLLQFARTDSSSSASVFVQRAQDDPQLIVRMEAMITAVIRGMTDASQELEKLIGHRSYRDIQHKTTVYLSAFLERREQFEVLREIWMHEYTTDETRLLILNWLERENNVSQFQQTLVDRFWESKHFELKSRILRLIARAGEDDFCLALKQDLVKIAPAYWISLIEKAQADPDRQNDQSR